MGNESINISKTLRRLMFEKNIRVSKLARELHIPQPTLHRIVSGITTNPRKSILNDIAAYFSVSVQQLKGLEPTQSAVEWDYPITKRNIQEIPLIEWDDLNEIAEDENDLLRQLSNESVIVSSKLNSKCYATIMNDKSMEPLFSKGTTLIFDPDLKPINRAFVLVQTKSGSKTLFRELLINEEYTYLKPLNTNYISQDLKVLDKTDKIIGTLVESRRNYENTE